MSRAPRTDEACLSATRALCNSCGRLSEAKLVLRPAAQAGQPGQVFLVKWCPEHGESEALVSSDQDWTLASLSYVKPATVPRERAVAEHRGCPDSCGLCPEHQQHTCVPFLEITGRCNLSCPICLVGAPRGGDVPLAHIERMVQHLLRYEGQLNMLTLSGGEPTLHPQLEQVLDLVQRKEIGLCSISTNGVALAEDEDLIRRLRDRGVVIALQLDGFGERVSARLRGRAELGPMKRRLVQRILELGATLSLTVTLCRGVNEAELPELLRLVFDEEQVVSIMVQPLAAFDAARAGLPQPEPLTVPDVVQLLVQHSAGVLEPDDFTPLPCSHPSCFALTYLLRTGAGRLVPLPRLVQAEDYLDIIKNQALFGTDTGTLLKVRDSLYGIWSSDGIVPDRDAVLGAVRRVLLELNQLGPRPEHREVLELGARHVKSIFIHAFMDRYSFDLSRAIKCCNHYPQPDGRLLPACVRNNLLGGLGRC